MESTSEVDSISQKSGGSNMLRFKIFSFVLVFVLFSSSLLFAQFDQRIVYQVPGMDKIQTFKNLTYKTADTTELKMDIYTPPDLPKDGRLPAVIFIHGGYLPRNMSPQPKDWGVYISYGELMAASGRVGVTFNHRYWGWDEQNMNISFSDVKAAIQFVRDNANKYHIDPDRIALWAFSGGGPHLSIALKEKMDYIRCIISYYASLDLRPSVQQLSQNIDPKTVEPFSPIVYLTEDNYHIPPIFIGRAGLDNPTMNLGVDAFITRALSLNETIEVMNHPVGRHAFDILDDDDRSREIIARTIEFIKTQTSKDIAEKDATVRITAKLYAMMMNGEIEKSKKLYAETIRKFQPDQLKNLAFNKVISEATLNGIGYGLMQSNKPEAALEILKWNVELYPDSPNVYDSLADGYEANGQIELAIQYSKKALDILEKIKDIPEAHRNSIRQSAEGKLKRLKRL